MPRRSEVHLIAAVQAHCARVAIGPSAVRGRGNAGLAEAARDYLSRLDLGQFATSCPACLRRCLDDATCDLASELPTDSRFWGMARKLLNIFLRDATYSFYLRDAFGLGKAEHLLEVPLDSITASSLCQEISGVLPKWPRVRHLSPGISDIYQSAAEEIASNRGIARVHLDAYWWGMRQHTGPKTPPQE